MSSSLVGLTPVTQRIEGWPLGECVRATYSALLDLPIGAIPRFDPASLRPGERQRDRERAWLASLGLYLDEMAPEELDAVPPYDEEGRPIFHLISGLSPRGFGHRCVGWGGEVLWDPHPSRAGLVTVYSLGFLEPIHQGPI